MPHLKARYLYITYNPNWHNGNPIDNPTWQHANYDVIPQSRKCFQSGQGQKDFAACTKPRNFQFSATNRDFLRFPRQIAKFPILRDKSRFFQSSAKNRAFSFKSEDQICAFSFKSEDQICAFSFKSEDQVCVFSIKSAGQMSRFLQVLSK